jgi:archaellum biogenesis protein FlaJ (TadC family)
MRIGNGLWVSGGSGVAGFWLLLSFFAVFFAILFTLVQLLASLIAEAAKHAAERKAKQEAKEQASRVMATAIPLSQVVNPVSGSKVSVMRKLWGAYALVPAVGQTSILSGSIRRNSVVWLMKMHAERFCYWGCLMTFQ